MPRRAWLAFALATVLLAANGAGATSPATVAAASSKALGVRVVIPGAAGGATQLVSAPQDTVELAGSFSCCGTTPVLTTGQIGVQASADTSAAIGSASAEISSVSLFGGEVTVASVVAKAHAAAGAHAATSDVSGSVVSGFVVDGVAAATSGRVALGDWGYALLLGQSATQGQTPTPNGHATVTALDIHLTADHGGLPAGSEIVIGYADATAQAASPQSVPTPPRVHRKPSQGPKAKEPESKTSPGSPLLRAPPTDLHPKLTAGRYVFPIYGPSSFVDTYGSARADVTYHHGDDIFAPLGAPVLAVADGTVFSVGWNAIGGNRLWLRDTKGNEFYYAHLSAFTPLAVNGAQVHAGDVLGFVGNTGDAQGTPYHLHFEVHPVGLLGLGYDGAVDPSPYLTAWQHLQDVRFEASGGWAPAAAHSTAPAPGAILLQVSDISSANGLDPASLKRAFLPAGVEGDVGLVRATVTGLGGGAARQLAAHD